MNSSVEIHSYARYGIMLWFGISLNNYADFRLLCRRNTKTEKYWDKTLDPDVRYYSGTIGNKFNLMDDST
ncbi:hypothetical protein CEXT_476191 [Caerostris extrusa]|uniref:Uncharacterized protein n=1 Tax=Caerostris extrusa TaxID=172846 RepID=A0AAV4W9P3_CAEEX|nr:hypothetical protein CEXT_476191 [Caerostris extrusa]